MVDDKGNVLGDPAEPTNPPATDVNPNSPATDDKGDPGTPKADTTPKATDDDKGAEPSGAEKRIRQLVAERHARDRRIAELESQIKDKPAEAAKPVVTQDGLPVRPQVKDFVDYDDYIASLAAWNVEVTNLRKEASAVQKKNIDAIKRVDEDFKTRIDEDSIKNPDITTIRDRVGQKISTAVGFAIKQSEAAPDLIRYLDANPSEMERLSKLDLVAAAREIGKIEVKLTAAPVPAKIKSGAPEPVKPAGSGSGSVTAEKSDDEIPIEDYMKKFRSKGKK